MTNHRISRHKVLVLCILLFLALLEGAAIFVLQLRINNVKYLRLRSTPSKSSRKKAPGEKEEIPKNRVSTTIQSTKMTDPKEIYSLIESSFPPPSGSSLKTIGQAYWRHASTFLQQWDATMMTTESSTTTTSNQETPVDLMYHHHYWNRDKLELKESYTNNYPRLALEQAANAGHPLAQYYLANAHASGIWPFISNENVTSKLEIMEEWNSKDPQHHAQVSKSFLLWHMSAMAGNVEAAMALAIRADQQIDRQTPSDNAVCMHSLPYYEAAAHGLMDQLEASPNSRGKVRPPMDKHVLAWIHMHGGTSSQLDWYNKPDESKEIIQFYHLKATTEPWSYGKKDNEGPKQTTVDVEAAATLGYYYHYGVKGVEQNLTKALMYYEIAGNNSHWESAGNAGTFYLWGMGTEQNTERALKYFKIGAPRSFEFCYRRFELAVLKKKGKEKEFKNHEEGDNIECDAKSLNGMGLIYLLGIPSVIEIDYQMATKYFALAKESGDADAYYNLGMMYLGWKTNYQNSTVKEGMEQENGQSVSNRFPLANEREIFALHHSARNKDGHYLGPSEKNVKKALILLDKAAKEGHLQAIHRLAMIFAEGVKIQTGALEMYTLVKKDCRKAQNLYEAIINVASVERSKRLRLAYKEYMEGDLEVSLRNYLAAAESGSRVGQLNAAFLLERGICLGLNPSDCAKAAVRLWKVAADQGSAEACLRVGDFYYYGRLRGKTLRHIGPFSWMQYILHPEIFVFPQVQDWISQRLEEWGILSIESRKVKEETENICHAEGSCEDEERNEQEMIDADLSIAAHYYQIAVDKHRSARANFNLGFMHEWGIGLKQDFPLAKRHYDLASTVNAAEATLAVQIALLAMSQHEAFLKLKASLSDWWLSKEHNKGKKRMWFPQVKLYKGEKPKTKKDVILDHVFDETSLYILVLMFGVLKLMLMRGRRLQERDQARRGQD